MNNPDTQNDGIITEEAGTGKTEAEESKNRKKARKEKKNRGTGALKFLQHVLITAAALAVFMYIAGSIVVISNYNGSRVYKLNASDQTRSFEDSVFFNTVFGREAEDVLRYVTIRSQMETGGVYDPDKIIDISAYNARHTGSKNSNITAKYYLGDLLKWTKYGFEYQNVTVPERTVSGNYIVDNGYGGSGGGLWFDGEDVSVRDVLINRYHTVDGLILEQYVDNWDDYDILCNELQTCAEDLFENYTEYLRFNDYFDDLNSNIRYCVIMGEGRGRIVYSNLEPAVSMSPRVEETFKKYGRYISYDFDRMVYDTDSAISESTFNTLLYPYRYAFTDDCKIYIAADLSMPADDSIRAAQKGFRNTYLPDQSLMYLIAVVCVILYLVLLVICTIREGRSYDVDGVRHIRFSEFDHTPIELWIIILGAVIGLFVGLPLILLDEYYDRLRFVAMDHLNDIYVYILVGVIVFVFDLIMLGLYYSLVRRIKGRHIWKQSFLYKLICGCKKGVYAVYDNGNVLLRSVIPFAVLALINLALVIMMARDFYPILCLVSLMIIDIIAGVFIFRQVKDREEIISVMKKIISGDISQGTNIDKYHGDNRELSASVNSIGGTIRSAVEKSMKDERMKADLVANVSHDIRTPLTSIINYVDLIKRENIEDPKISEYIGIIDEKSQRLKTLTEDLIEASKVSSGNVDLELVKINLPEMVTQTLAEFDEKLSAKNLQVVTRTDLLKIPGLMADGRSLWRVMENLMGNVCKYAMTGTRVFVDMFNTQDPEPLIVLRVTNISENPLPEDLSELTERFIRGDESRTSEGSGLGLSIAKSLTELMGGTFRVYSEADLFKAEIVFKSVV